MKRLAPFALSAILGLTHPLAVWAQSTTPPSVSDQVEQRLKQLRNAPQVDKNAQPAAKSNTLTQSELNTLMKRIANCWTLPQAAREMPDPVTVQVKLAKDGSLAAPPKVVNSSPDPRFAVAAKASVAALTRCAPFSFLPAAKYDAWKEIQIDFDVRSMFGDKP
jgi:hypothetical protein